MSPACRQEVLYENDLQAYVIEPTHIPHIKKGERNALLDPMKY